MLEQDDIIEILWFLKAVSVELRGLERDTVYISNNSLIEFERKFDKMLEKLEQPNK